MRLGSGERLGPAGMRACGAAIPGGRASQGSA
jgi:hypothetical protein